MLSVTYKPLMLNVIMLSVTNKTLMLNVIILSVIMLNVTMLSVVIINHQGHSKAVKILMAAYTTKKKTF